MKSLLSSSLSDARVEASATSVGKISWRLWCTWGRSYCAMNTSHLVEQMCSVGIMQIDCLTQLSLHPPFSLFFSSFFFWRQVSFISEGSRVKSQSFRGGKCIIYHIFDATCLRFCFKLKYDHDIWVCVTKLDLLHSHSILIRRTGDLQPIGDLHKCVHAASSTPPTVVPVREERFLWRLLQRYIRQCFLISHGDPS